ncbi:PTS transporter subunit EIIC [Paenibacillus macquariensis]|uniref:PTS system N-acetylglucosamine-specific IIB component, Glc family /PTS system N-acetylglucosamine-specific IIC component, Glc family n=1 Tax=Paenibacillus macquariensis TaxID=948756 RepID=A0ABY1K4J6_9BACL|nr:PTS transporter subunit EIIC [Paenibacillus macquariensis]MEC0089022.1 PTS transporter subunit EIIC [Paenibacillus macquariensis]OAB31844.1 PTS sugar transporter [Paenibacillus macquariensis subsp. macquariensis]SIR24630.1 PTS system N-acetylglucosamine-specific IIB component, Glc family /PTS system N-acetylglucosamine-specific IIC component, Glc family [Paenibacillus macquariensis]
MLAFLQKIGKSLMLPVATLPAAAILMRFGNVDYIKDFHMGDSVGGFLNTYVAPFLNAGGGTIFDNLPLIFAVGVAIGLAGDAVAALSAVIGYMILAKVLLIVPGIFPELMQSADTKLNMGVLGGILVGCIAAGLYKKYHKIKLPDWLGFFGGKRFVPMATAFTMVVVGLVCGLVWGPVQAALDTFGGWVTGLGGVGSAIHMVANRLLVPFGLHHIINSIVWFQIGDFVNAAGDVVHGDLTRFFAKDPSAGMFMTGFFPVMMFGLPAAAFAIIHTAKPERRKAIGSIFIGAAFASFLTGITEPLEFAFMFVAPLLYGVHVVLSGAVAFISYAMGMKLGFGFSAGFLDYAINYQLATKPLLLIPIGLVTAVVYYVVFRFLIVKFNLKTPGREDEVVELEGSASGAISGDSRAAKILSQLGGSSNIESVDACITRLRLIVKDEKVVNDAGLKQLGAAGVMRLGKGAVQVVFGPQSETIKDEINDIL